jgi:hypothetical protein
LTSGGGGVQWREHTGSLAVVGASVLTLLCVGLLASYVASWLVYKIWYVAAAAACALALLLAVATAIRVDGLAGALFPVLAYFSYLAVTSLWASYPEVTLTWVAIDSIELPVVALFYLWALNSPPRQLCWSMVALAYLCIPITVVLHVVDPEAERFGYRALGILPMLVPFCWMLWRRERSVVAVLGIASILAMLLVSRSRTPLGAAVVGLLLCVWSTSTSRREFLRRGLLASAGVTVLAGLLFALPITRALMASTVSRLTYLDVDLGDTMIEAEAVDEVRWNVFFNGLALWWEHQPLGMGYMNFMAWFEVNFGNAMPLHNSLQTWALEGGLPCLAIVGWMLLRYFRVLAQPLGETDCDARILASALRNAMVITLLTGLFHHPQQAPMLFALLGMGYAFARRYREPRYLISRGALFAGLAAR